VEPTERRRRSVRCCRRWSRCRNSQETSDCLNWLGRLSGLTGRTFWIVATDTSWQKLMNWLITIFSLIKQSEKFRKLAKICVDETVITFRLKNKKVFGRFKLPKFYIFFSNGLIQLRVLSRLEWWCTMFNICNKFLWRKHKKSFAN